MRVKSFATNSPRPFMDNVSKYNNSIYKYLNNSSFPSPCLASEYGLFDVSDEDRKQGVWLESGRNLDFYMLRNQDVVEYRRKLRTLRVRMLDGAVKTILVDDSQTVSQLMVVICTKIGLTNHEEYGLVREDPEPVHQPDNRTTTLRRDAKMDSLRKKLRTDDESKTFFLKLLCLFW